MTETLSCDYLIIGAGAAGSVLAARLAEEGKYSVILVEAGPDNTEDEYIQFAARFPFLLDFPAGLGPHPSPSHWGFTTFQNGKLYSYPRGTGLGGSTNHHPAVDGRGSSVIYDDWARIANHDRWLYKNLLPYFIKMENYQVPDADDRMHGKKGWLYIGTAKLEKGFHEDLIRIAEDEFNIPFRKDFYDDPSNFSGLGLATAQIHPDGRRSNAAVDLLKPIYLKTQKQGWNNLKILVDTFATKIIFEGNQAVGLEAVTSPRVYTVDAAHNLAKQHKNNITHKKIIRAKKEIIVSCGAINTPQLLMLSGVGPKDELKTFEIPVVMDLEGVGRHLQDHLETALVYKIQNLPNKVWRWQAALFAEHDTRYHDTVDTTALTENGIPLVCDWFSGYDVADPKHPDLHIHFINAFFRDFNLNPEKFQNADSLKASVLNTFLSQLDSNNPSVYHSFLIETLKPSSTLGSIRLQSNDPYSPPLLDLGLYQAEADLSRVALGLQWLRKMMLHPDLQKYQLKEVLPGQDFRTTEEVKEYIRQYSSLGHHISGTAKMGSQDDSTAVVDADLKVRNLKNLRICDTSVFPSIPAYNTSRAAYLLGEVLADILLNKK